MGDSELDQKNDKTKISVKEKFGDVERILKRISAIIIILGAITGGIAGIVMNIEKITGIFKQTSKNGSEISDTPKDCFDLKTLTPNILPHYLLPSMGGSKNFPFWLKFVGKNNCNKTLWLEVLFEQKTGVTFATQSEPLRIKAQKPFTAVVEPDDIQLRKPETRYVKIIYTVMDESGTIIIDKGLIETQIVEPYTIAWDLQKPSAQDGKVEPVDRDFLVASLAAWVIRPPKIVAELGHRCRTPPKGHGQLVKIEALRSCYKILFRDDPTKNIIVHDTPIKLPDGKRQRIKPLSGVVKEKSATSLEAALLFVAVMNKKRVDGIDPELLLLAVPVEKNSLQKSVYITWSEPGAPWQAIDMRKVNHKSFDDNITESSEIVNKSYKSQIRKAIEAGGVFFSTDESIVVLHFKIAIQSHNVWAVPNING